MKVLRNLAVLALGAFGAAGFAFLSSVVLARHLGPAAFGDYAFAFTLATLVAAVAGFGMGTYWLQAYGRYGAPATRMLRASLPLLACSLLLGVMLQLLVAWSQGGERGLVAALFIGVMLAQVASALAQVRFQLEDRQGLVAAWQGVPALARFLVSVACVAGGLGLTGIAVAHALLFAVSLASSGWVLAHMARGRVALHGHAAITPLPLPAQPGPREALREAWPFALSGAMYFIYHRSDVVILGFFDDGAAVGVYAAAVTLLLAVYLVPAVVQRFLLARMFRWGAHDRPRLYTVYCYGCGNLLVLALVLAGAIWLLAPWLVKLLYGDRYAGTGEALRLLMLAVPARFIGTIVGSVLVTGEQNRAKTRAQVQAALLMAGAGVLLAPLLSWHGVAAAVICTEYFLLWRYLAIVDAQVFPGATLRGWRVGIPGGLLHG